MQRFIIGLISGILICVISYAVTTINSHIDERDTKSYQTKVSINSINIAIELYYKETGKLPSSEEGIQKLSPKYVDYVMPDPWGNEYFYATFKIKEKSCYVVWSYGSDLKPGGINEASDIFMFGRIGNCF
jgi:hypothetical protein